LADRSVDLVAINAALHHMPDPQKVLKQIDHVLKPGGYFALGFEPNLIHFSSPIMPHLSRGMDRLSWYASLQQNRRRWREWMGCQTRHKSNSDDPVINTMNNRLVQDGYIDQPLSTAELMDLVDPHSRNDDHHAGFDPFKLIRQSMPNYQVRLLFSSDYLGLSMRRWPMVRRIIDTMFRALAPRHGLLFSWLLRKPDHPAQKEEVCQ